MTGEAANNLGPSRSTAARADFHLRESGTLALGGGNSFPVSNLETARPHRAFIVTFSDRQLTGGVTSFLVRKRETGIPQSYVAPQFQKVLRGFLK